MSVLLALGTAVATPFGATLFDQPPIRGTHSLISAEGEQRAADDFTSSGPNLSFSLSGLVVPEPSFVSLSTLSLALFLIARKR